MKIEDVTVVSQHRIAEDIYEITVHGRVVNEMTTPGQFVHIKIGSGFDALLRRPISICDVNLKKQEMKMIYRVEGSGTKLLSEKKPGNTMNVLGPLGNGFPIEGINKGQTALLVGGGIGVPPLYFLSKQLVEKGVEVEHVLGFSSVAESFLEKEFSYLGETFVATVDGSLGQKGFVTDAIGTNSLGFDTLYACGPTAMLKALEGKFQGGNAYFSLEQRMGCAVGACLACVCPVAGDETGTRYRKVCSDGPVFPMGEVVI
jgi:dihydroorotate dehydrogenase electron transfer subunit